MKKNYLTTGIVYVCIGAALLVTALFTETALESLLWGFAGAAIVPGLSMILRYFYWTHPDNRARYDERLENERIELHDERNVRLREKAGYLAYLAGLLFICVSMVTFSVLEKLGVIESARLIVLYLAGLFMLQLAAASAFSRYLAKKY